MEDSSSTHLAVSTSASKQIETEVPAIKDVWLDTFFEEMDAIEELIKSYSYVSMVSVGYPASADGMNHIYCSQFLSFSSRFI